MKNVGQLAKKFDVVLQNGSTTLVGRTARSVDRTSEIKRLNMLFENMRSTYDFWMHKAMEVEDDNTDNDGNIDEDKLSAKDKRILEGLTISRKKWLAHLHPYTDEQISSAVIKCEETISKLAGPTIAEFLSFCKGAKWVAAHQDYKALPPPKNDNREIGLKALDEAKRKVKRK